MAGGFGPSPLTFAEIRAWSAQLGFELLPWEARFLRRLSIEWCNQASKSEDADCPPPWGEISVPTREEVARKIDALLG